jgi:DNA-binding beta-propeller fold protein YncE
VTAAFAVVFCTVQLTRPVLAQNANGSPSPDCRSEQGLTYLCGFNSPEDVVNVGSTGLVLASGHRAPGDMYLIDPVAGTWSELIQGADFRLQHDAATVDVHGISLAVTSDRRFSIYTTSHGDREAIEIYDLDLRASAPILTWKGCVLLQQDGYFNGVAQLPDGGFVTTRMRDADARMDQIEPGTITGSVFEWHPGGQLQPLAGTELSLPNGIDVSADGRYIYVTATFTQELVRFDRHATPTSKHAISLPMLPDNVHWDGNGNLLIAGPDPLDAEACDGGRCPSGWTVVEVDPETFAVTRLGGANASAAMQRASAAMRVGNEIWVGSNQDRIARFPLNQ